MANDDIEIIDENSYCPKCGGCGYVGCCGIKDFFDEHVRGKTDCPYEEIFLSEIEAMVAAEHEELYKSIVQDDPKEIL